MSLEQIVTLLVNPDDDPVSRHRRAIKLFEFQVSLFDGKDFRRLIFGKDSKTLRKARLFAAIKILEANVQKVDKAHKTNAPSIENLLTDAVFRDVFNLFLEYGGWTQILQTSSARYFETKIAEQRKAANTAANIINFLYRFLKNPPDVSSTRRRNARRT